MSLAQPLAAYAAWRGALGASLARFGGWLAENAPNEARNDARLTRLLDRLRDDRLRVAVVAEFSRGKSELINALFFADLGDRVLPSSVGRTTMCPTELMFDPAKPPGIELLPIGTRDGGPGIAECRRHPELWTRLAFDPASVESMRAAMQHVGDVQRVPPETAARLGFEAGAEASGEDVEVPRWRHALINFPHPLLREGLVILDTPGLNAIGSEPELTLSLLPNAHAILFVLAADTGVSQSDLDVWRNHLAGIDEAGTGRLVVLNKIDGQWDELKSPAEIDALIDRQAGDCARILGLPAARVFPVSAQKGLVARVTRDAALLARSRLPALESAFSGELIPNRQRIVGDDIGRGFSAIEAEARSLLEAKLAGLREQQDELRALHGKNRSAVEYMMRKARTEKETFESAVRQHQAVRSVLSTLSNRLFADLGLDPLRALTLSTREAMQAATFSRHLSEAMSGFLAASREALSRSAATVDEIQRMTDAVYRKLSVEHGLRLGHPPGFTLERYERELDRLEAWCDAHLNTMYQLMRHKKAHLTQRFFEEVAVQVRRAFEHANREADGWLKASLAPIESQVREHHGRLRHRLDSIRRIHEAAGTLEERLDELEREASHLRERTGELDAIAREVRETLERRIDPAAG